ncbi:hypothetical protein ABW19_dt0206090 [Dactylella cylindrospora]|nr:hypothetical protein ABW19_dt0206090 [Dactylella cylindrospora]
MHITLLLAAALLSTPIRAFFPNSYLSVGSIGGINHRVQTERAIRMIYEDLGITEPTDTMNSAREEIKDANEHTDFNEAELSAAHFDGERFVPGSQRLKDLYQGILDDMNGGQVSAARIKAGRSLHTVQDFYSHSNWIELGNGIPHPGVLGNPDAADELRAASGAATCSSCAIDVDLACTINCATRFGANFLAYLGCVALCSCPTCEDALITRELTSGYYYNQGNDRPDGKCAHGGPFDAEKWYNPLNVNRHPFGINKDSLFCKFSPNGSRYHTEAARVAILSTVAWLRNLRAGLGDDKFKQLLGLGPSLGFAIDTTGSMGPIIASVRQEAIDIVNQRLGTADEPSFYVLVGFNDPDVTVYGNFSSVDAFKTAIMSLTAGGGGDCPEYSITGMRDAVANLGAGGSLFMFTDADAKDVEGADALVGEAKGKGIKIVTAVFGECAVGGMGVYQRIARETLGQFFDSSIADAGTITRLTDSIGRSNSVDLLSVTGDFVAGARKRATGSVPYVVSVDSTLSQVTFSLSSTGVTMAVQRPDGSVIKDGDTGVAITTLSAGTFITIVSPPSGNYIINLDGTATAAFSLAVSGISTLSFTKFSFLETSDGMHHDWVGYLTTNTTPAAGSTGVAVAIIDGSWKSASFDVRGETGKIYETINLTPGTGEDGDREKNEFVGAFTVPDCPFIVYITGTDSAGAPFQRFFSGLITPPGAKDVCNDGPPPLPSSSTTMTSSSTTSSTSSSFSRYYNTSTTVTTMTTTRLSSTHLSTRPRTHSSKSTTGKAAVTTCPQGGYTRTYTLTYTSTATYPPCSYAPPVCDAPMPHTGYPYPSDHTAPIYTPGSSFEYGPSASYIPPLSSIPTSVEYLYPTESSLTYETPIYHTESTAITYETTTYHTETAPESVTYGAPVPSVDSVYTSVDVYEPSTTAEVIGTPETPTGVGSASEAVVPPPAYTGAAEGFRDMINLGAGVVAVVFAGIALM